MVVEQARQDQVDDTVLWTIDFPCMVVDDMTMLIACIEQNDILLAADGCGMIGSDARHDKDIKSIRVNSDVAIGISGSPYHASLVLADLFGHSELAAKEEEFTRIWEEDGLSSDISFSDIEDGVKKRALEVEHRSEWIEYLEAQKYAVTRSVILIAGVDRGEMRMLALKTRPDGSVFPEEQCRYLPVGPEMPRAKRQECMDILQAEGDIRNRLIETVRQCARHDERVNKNVLIRRLGSMEPFQAEWFLTRAKS